MARAHKEMYPTKGWIYWEVYWILVCPKCQAKCLSMLKLDDFREFVEWFAMELSLSCMIDQRFYIGLKSGELAGQVPLGQKWGIFLVSQSWVLFEVCAGAPSCWKIAADMSGNNFLTNTDPVSPFRCIADIIDFFRISSI